MGFEAGDSQKPRVQLANGECVIAVPGPKASGLSLWKEGCFSVDIYIYIIDTYVC